MNIIELDHVSFSYVKDTPVLKEVTLNIKKGEWISILGHNGSGKSTLSKLMIGLLKARQGEIRIDGVALNEETVYDIRKKIGIVFQNPDNQFVGVTVEDDIAFGMENLEIPREEMIKNIETYAKKVDMFEYLKKEPYALSGGQKQRVAIAGILAMHTDIIIFDEATSMLDPKGRDVIMEYMRKLSDEGKTIITITHDMKEAVYADQIVVLKEGQIITKGSPKEVFSDRALLNSSNLELLTPLKLLHMMDEEKIENDCLKDILWAYSLKM